MSLHSPLAQMCSFCFLLVSSCGGIKAVDDLRLRAVAGQELGAGGSQLPAAPQLCSLLWPKQGLTGWL